MRQFSTKQAQPAQANAVTPASSRSVTPTPGSAPAHRPSRTAVPPAGFGFSRIAVHGTTPMQLQPKLMIGASGDAFEQEADRVAEQVMHMPQPVAQSPARAGFSERPIAPGPQLQTKSLHIGDVGGLAAPPVVHDVLRSPGQPLDAATRAFMEPRFGHDFSKVRVHADARAAEAASSIGARAFTSNRGVVFGGGAYAPQTESGRRLLAHELTHVVQQQGSIYPKDGARHAGVVYERQANIAGGQSLVQRQVIPKQIEKQDDDGKEDAKEVSADYWLDVIPDADVKAGDKRQPEIIDKTKAQGGLTNFSKRTFSYAQAAKAAKKKGKAGKSAEKPDKAVESHEIATAAPLDEGVTQADVDKAVAAIVSARAKILQRYMKPIGKGGYSGYESQPKYDKERDRPHMGVSSPAVLAEEQKRYAETMKGVEASRNYTKWSKTATPTRAANAKNLKDPELRKKLQIANYIIQWEGVTSAINAYDKENVTWGWGFAAAKQAQQLTLEVFKQSAEARDAFFSAGIAVDATKKDHEEYVVVDTEKKWKLRGQDAELYIRGNKTLLSLMVNVAQGLLPEKPSQGSPDKKASEIDYLNSFGGWKDESKQPDANPKADPAVEQAVLDANFETLLANTLAGSDKILEDEDWTIEQAALAAHAIHAAPGLYSWKDWAKLKPHEIKDIVQEIHKTTTAPNAFNTIVVPLEWRAMLNEPKKQKVGKGKKKEAAKK
jgi:hypothetical protein